MRLLLMGQIFFSALLIAAPIITLPHSTTQLENGLTVTLVQYPSPATVAYQLSVRVGSRNEIQKGTTGFAHFFEHLMFRGTKNRTGQEYGNLLTRLGAENNAWTASDLTVYHGMVSSQHLTELLEAEADRFMNLSFNEKAFREEAGAVIGEYNKEVSSPEFQMEEKLYETAFSKHTYGHTTMGYKSDIFQFGERYKDVWPFFETYYRPENTTLILVGDIEFEKLLPSIRKSFGGWKRGTQKTPAVPREPVQKEMKQASVKLNKQTQTRVAIAHKIPAFAPHSRDSGSLELIDEIYFSVVSDFQKTYRFEKQWLDSVEANPPMPLDPGLWVIHLRFTEGGEQNQNEIINAVTTLLSKIATDPASEATVERARKRVRNTSILNWLQASDSLAGLLSVFSAFGDAVKVANQWLETVGTTTAKDLSLFSEKYLKESQRTIVTLRGSSR